MFYFIQIFVSVSFDTTATNLVIICMLCGGEENIDQ